MALPDEPLARSEQYLNRTATGSGTIPDEPLTRVEMYLNKIATGDGNVPEVPLTRMEQYLDYIAENGGGGGSVPENITNILLKIHEILSYGIYTQDVTGDLSTLLDMINSGGGGGDDSDENVYQIGSTLYIISDVNAVKYGSSLTLS